MVCVIKLTFVTEIEVGIYTNKNIILQQRLKQAIKNQREIN